MGVCIGGTWNDVISNVLGFFDLPKTKLFPKSGKEVGCGVA